MNTRSSWDKTRMDLIKVIAQRSVCENYKVGTLLYRDKMPLVFGYNGPSKGEPHCNEVGCAKMDKNGNMLPAGSGLCRGGHAETNAIANAATNGINVSECGIICTYSPCYDCAKILMNLSIVEFVYEKKYTDEFDKVKDLFSRRGVILRKFEE